ncbi:type II toxin-antitoxin system death-on-curing family toxin [Corynebacterium lowii]|uniref:type II toxin-antitoxin system death-on-curing family toxin n=1 Tax=Corynebacterium lowii TaxID=1544413 RepID=UPI0009E81A33|nr:type II toxin-antitoxin system death-on-curing family toxin [Corynebacterium lowii]MDP9851947.1 death-on-curing protein [Corynebacterium lowii]
MKDVVRFNEELCGRSPTLLDAGKLEAALARPLQEVFGVILYPTIMERAAVLLEGVARAHAFIDANKRTAWWAAMTYLGIQGISISARYEESGQVVIDLVEGRHNHHDVTLWLIENAD